ncbi:hypothetical protein [Listeria farberi]|uniref:Uncharacterized protein n=1 Tax=Listeria farberi TaxID=2713500 RepID=A0A7X0ZFS8_9LIST|nr:hypothetical protein [Listeria farberi]MBC2267057.1 hypothetical protein [Listeria farberi]MBC2286511.1 hypothetical protein [Listeria farberi]
MERVLEYNIDNKNSLTIYMDELTERIHWDTKIQIKYETENTNYLLWDDNMLEGIRTFKTMLELALNNRLDMTAYSKYPIGYYENIEYNEISMNKMETMSFEKPLLWSSIAEVGNETFLYNSKNKVILEVSPIYKWHFDEPKILKDFITFDEFMKQYKPYIVQEISRDIVNKFISKSTEFLNKYFSDVV